MREQVRPGGPESGERGSGAGPGGEVRVCLGSEPLPPLFVKKAVAALFAKVCMGMSARFGRLPRANICLRIHDILLDTPVLKTAARPQQRTGCLKPI